MLDYFGDVFNLKSNTHINNIWQCIRECFQETTCSGYLDETPTQKQYVNDTKKDFILSWSCPTETQPWFMFEYVGRYAGQNVSIRIVFDKNITYEKNTQMHHILFEETNNSNGEIVFFRSFLSKLQKWVIDKYYDTQITNDTDGVLFPLLLMGENGIAVTKRIAENSFQHNDEYAKFLKQPKNLHLFQKMWRNTESLIAVFYNDVSESELREKEIKALKRNLWYLNIDFVYCGRMKDQLLANFTDKFDIIEKIVPSDRQGRQFLNTEKQRKFQSMRSIIQEKAKIRLFSAKGKLIKEYDSLDVFQNDLLNHFDFSLSDFEAKIKSEFSDYYDNQSKDESEINQRVELRLKEIGVDSLAEQCRTLKNDNEEKEKKIRKLESRISLLESQSNESKTDETVQASFDNPKLNEKINELLDKIKEKDQKNSEQSDEIYNMNKRIQDLEKRLNEKRATEYDGYYHLHIPCSRKEAFTDEIEDYLYKLIYDRLSEMPKPNNATLSRKIDIIETLMKEKTFDWDKTETSRKLAEIERILRENKRPNIDKLCSVGFVEKERSGDHVKCWLYDIPYQIMFSLSPSDFRTADNMMSIIRQQCFIV